MRNDRRTFLAAVAASGAAGAAGSLLASCARSAPAAAQTPDKRDKRDKPGGKPDDDDEVTPAEDLMREHGVLRRVMYLYDEAADRLLGLAAAREAARDVPLDALASCAGIVRRVIEEYHEKLEEDFVFPRFEKAGKLAELRVRLRADEAAQLGKQHGVLARCVRAIHVIEASQKARQLRPVGAGRGAGAEQAGRQGRRQARRR
jgi:hypothetical protein